MLTSIAAVALTLLTLASLPAFAVVGAADGVWAFCFSQTEAEYPVAEVILPVGSAGGRRFLPCDDAVGIVTEPAGVWTLSALDGTVLLTWRSGDTFELYAPTRETLTREELLARYSTPCDIVRAYAAGKTP